MPAVRKKGTVIAYSSAVNAGTVESENNKTYLFSRKEWKLSIEPAVGLEVYFFIEGDSAKSVQAERGD